LKIIKKKISRKKSSDIYTYGEKRAELIGGLLNSVFLISTGIFITLESIPKFISPEELKGGLTMTIVAIISLSLNLFSTIVFG
jgi:Co/Zn/Cd efflux system component